MNEYSEISESRLLTCDIRIQKLFRYVLLYFDNSIICGHRDEKEQNRAFEDGFSTKQWPDSKHNTLPSLAIDAAPHPVNWKDKERFCYFAGFVMAAAIQFGILLRWGRDWDRDTDLSDQTFNDYAHFEIIKT